MKKLLPLGLALASVLTGTQAHAASSTWLDTGSAQAWNSTSNWVGGVVPGNTTSGVTTSTDTGTFNSAVGTVGTSGNPVLIDSGRTIGGITFDSSSVGSFTIGTTAGNSLYLTSGAAGISMTNTAISADETINAPLLIGIGSTAATATITNNSTSDGYMTLGGTIGGATTNTVTLTLSGTNAGANTITGVIGNGSSSALSLTKTSLGSWTLTNANTYGGITTINGGTLTVTNTSGLGTNTSATAITLSNKGAVLNLLNDGSGSNGTITFGPGSGYNVTNSSTTSINVDHLTGHTGNTVELGSIANSSGLTFTNGDGYNLTFNGSGSFSSGSNFTNNMISGTVTLPNLTDVSASGGRGISFTGLSSSAVTVVGAIAPGTDSVALNLLTLGTLNMTGDSTYLGATNIDAGTLELTNSTGTALGSSAISMLGGTLEDYGSSAFNPTTATTVTFSYGSNTIATNGTTGHVLALGTLTRSAGAVMNFVPNSQTAAANGSITTSSANNTLGILGGWATVNGTSFATVSGSTITAYTGATNLTITSGGSSTTNYSLTSASTTLTGGLSVGSLKITDSGTSDAINLGANNLTFSTLGGLLVTGGGSYSINGTGVIGAGTSSGAEFIVNVAGTSTLTINSSLIGTTAGNSGLLTKAGAGTLILTATNSGFINGANLDGGVVQVASLAGTGTVSSLGSNGIIVLNGGTLSYVGSGVTTNRAFQFGPNGGEIDSSGSGALTINSSTFTPTTATVGTEVVTLGGSNTGSNTIASIIGYNGSGNSLAVTKTGAGTWVLSATNTYTGPTNINGGILQVTGSTVAGSSFTVNNGGALGGTGTVSGTVLVNTGGGINLRDGSIGTLTTGALTIGSGTGTTLTFDITSGSTSNLDLIHDNGTLTINGTGGVAITIDNLTGALTSGTTLTTGTYTLVSYTGQLSATEFANLSLSNTSLDGDTLSLINSAGALQLVITGSSSSPNYYFTGATSSDFTVAGNYNSLASSGTVQTAALSATSNVFLNATSPTPINTPATLNANASINSLNFVTAGTSLAGSGTVTLAATGTAGITDSAGVAGQVEMVAPAVILGSNQSWAATAGSTLNVTGSISGAQSLQLTGNGTYKFAGSNTFQGLTVGNGTDTPTLYLTNGTSGSATGTTTLRVNAGATLAGNGTSSGTSFNISGTGTATGARANVLVGLTSATDTLTTNVLTLKGTSSSTIADANLTFNLDAKSTASTQFSVGTTAIAFGTDAGSVKFTLDLQNEPAIVPNGTLYTLIAGTGSNQYTGLTLGNVINLGGGATETVITGNNLQLAFGGTTDQSFYGNGSYLVLYQSAGVDDIDVVVVPEPGTWALMLGGLALLVVVQRARRKNT